MKDDVILQRAANYFIEQKDLPSSSEVVNSLLEAEKIAKKEKISYDWENLLGTWRLCFVTGTKKTRKKAGIVLGAGRYLPRLVKISLNYSPGEEELATNQGNVENSVEIGGLQLSLTGPVRFLAPKNILAFDFTRMKVKLLGLTFYDGYIRNGKAKETSFYTDKISQQAFFAYFYITNSAIAARGRGGGLALWSKKE
ncbi:hypothetical protein Xen7305DRAFT_00021090 [Xenococcus sp. PCC 7305]|uniref:hypothetical protein n=1 Tax=Xenococcus sp. PCC 7305 TaxID=102125 RepID=UPI0002AC05C1|nr:hypothetical protein [Xenococcus sp. PCC 7305]ELS02395.1 hypothetical protein Xen7305DRAFT_00021090 [Xenococcus sp. PCC 7305]